MGKTVLVKILDLPGGAGGCCACGGKACGPDYAATMKQKVDELKAALEASHPGASSVEYVDLRENAAEKASDAGQLLVGGRYPPPVVVIDGEARFAGSVQVGRIVKAVGAALAD